MASTDSTRPPWDLRCADAMHRLYVAAAKHAREFHDRLLGVSRRNYRIEVFHKTERVTLNGKEVSAPEADQIRRAMDEFSGKMDDAFDGLWKGMPDGKHR